MKTGLLVLLLSLGLSQAQGLVGLRFVHLAQNTAAVDLLADDFGVVRGVAPLGLPRYSLLESGTYTLRVFEADSLTYRPIATDRGPQPVALGEDAFATLTELSVELLAGAYYTVTMTQLPGQGAVLNLYRDDLSADLSAGYPLLRVVNVTAAELSLELTEPEPNRGEGDRTDPSDSLADGSIVTPALTASAYERASLSELQLRLRGPDGEVLSDVTQLRAGGLYSLYGYYDEQARPALALFVDGLLQVLP